MSRRLCFVGWMTLLVLFAGCAPKRVPDVFLKLASEAYPEANGAVVFDSVFVECDSDGTGKDRTHHLAKVFTTYGKKEYGEASFGYLTNRDTLIVKYARTIGPDGKVIPVPKENITDRPMPAWEGSVFLIPNLRIVNISFPELEKGGGIEYEVERITHSAAFDSVFDSWFMFEGREPIESQYVEISLPKSMKPHYRVVHGELEHEEQDRGDRKLYVWKAAHVPRIIREPAMPSLPDVATKLVISTRPSWRQGSAWYYSLCEPRLEADSSVRAEVARLIEGKKSFEGRVRALYEFVNKNVRYVETKLLGKKGGFEPQDIAFTLNNKYGVCRDKAALLVGLLREAGIEQSYVVLTNPMMEWVDEIPALSQANHAIVAIETDTGWVYLDPTAESSVEFLTPYESDKPALICTRDGDDLLYTPKKPPEANLMEMKMRGDLGEDGELRQCMVMQGKGTMDMSLRQIFQHIPKEQFEEMILQSIKSTHGKARIDSISSADPADFSTPMSISIYVTIPDYPTVIGDEWHLSGGGEVQLSFGGGGNVWALEERRYPIEFGLSMKTHAEGSIFFPKGMKVKVLPEPFSYSGEYMAIGTSHEVKGNRILLKSEMVFKEHRIPQEEFQGLKEMMEEFSKQSKKEIILVKRR